MVSLMFGIVLVIVVITVAVAAMKDAHVVNAISNTKPDTKPIDRAVEVIIRS
jgi:hypothetical protein